MKYLLLVFFLFDGQWVQGDKHKGWGPIAYDSELTCLESKARAEGIHAQLRLTNPRSIEKRFECIAQQPETNN